MPTLEVVMIVRNGAATLARCLESVRGIADSILIGDTGSMDDSVEIACGFGARVMQVSWEDDFAKARNQVLDKATGDWILVLDADEMLDGQAERQIRQHITRGDVNAFEVWKWHYVHSLNSRSEERMAEPNPGLVEAAHAYPAYTRSLSTLLFRRSDEVRFEHRVHESVQNSLRRLGWRIGRADFVVHHFGFVEDGEARRRSKNEFYQRLGREKLRENPVDWKAHFELGLSELEHSRNPAEAAKYFWQVIRLCSAFLPAWIYAGVCMVRLEQHEEALQALEHAMMLGAKSEVMFEAMGDACVALHRIAQAIECYELAGSSALVQCKLGSTEVRAGRARNGLQRIESAVAMEERQNPAGAMVLRNIWVAAALMANENGIAKRAAEGAAPEYRKGLLDECC